MHDTVSERIQAFKSTVDADFQKSLDQILEDQDFIVTNHSLAWSEILEKLVNYLTSIIQNYFNADLKFVIEDPVNRPRPRTDEGEREKEKEEDQEIGDGLENIQEFLNRLINKLKKSFPDSPPFTILHIATILSFKIPVLFELPQEQGMDSNTRYDFQAVRLLRSLERSIYVQTSIRQINKTLTNLKSKNTTEFTKRRTLRKSTREMASEEEEDDDSGISMTRISWLNERTDLVENEGDNQHDSMNSDSIEISDTTDAALGDTSIGGEPMATSTALPNQLITSELEDDYIEELSLNENEKSLCDLSADDLENDTVSKSPKIVLKNYNESFEDSKNDDDQEAYVSESPKRLEKDLNLDHERTLKKSKSINSITVQLEQKLAEPDEVTEVREDPVDVSVSVGADFMEISTPEKKVPVFNEFTEKDSEKN